MLPDEILMMLFIQEGQDIIPDLFCMSFQGKMSCIIKFHKRI